MSSHDTSQSVNYKFVFVIFIILFAGQFECSSFYFFFFTLFLNDTLFLHRNIVSVKRLLSWILKDSNGHGHLTDFDPLIGILL